MDLDIIIIVFLVVILLASKSLSIGFLTCS